MSDNLTSALRGVKSVLRSLKSGLNPRKSEIELIVSDLAAAENILNWCAENRGAIAEAKRNASN